jgi:molybdopterin/thiamine biosynthesis adenylyltransferase/rhodanese-related sulfurtransferase
MDNREALLSRLRERISEVEPAHAHARCQAGATLLDVRESAESALGLPAGALAVPRSAIELTIQTVVPDPHTELLLMCGSGARSLLAADALLDLGYTRVSSVRGGYTAWVNADLPVRRESTLSELEQQRYSRQLILPEVGAAGQQKLKQARVLLIGAGGLGSPSALYLAAAGVGRLTLIDGDRVELSNLHRQVLHRTSNIGEAKVQSARQTLLALNGQIEVLTIDQRLAEHNVVELLRDHDLVIDGADNFPTRYLLDSAARQTGTPWVYGAVHRFEGQLSVFDPRLAHSPCYRCLFPHPPAPEHAPNCAEAGVLGAVPGVIGLLQAVEALKLLLGFGEVLNGRLLCFDARQAQFREIKLSRDPECPGCSANAALDPDLSVYMQPALCAAGL